MINVPSPHKAVLINHIELTKYTISNRYQWQVDVVSYVRQDQVLVKERPLISG